MTSNVIYHDFTRGRAATPALQNSGAVKLQASVLEKGRRAVKWNNGLGCACVLLCGACIGVSALVLCMLLGV